MVDNPAFADWPFHQSWELQIAGPFVEDDLLDLLIAPEFFGADFGGDNPSDSNFKLHASPIKDGDKFDVVPDGDPEDFTPNAIPEPTTIALLAIGGLLMLRRHH